jgi:hypothetical protein
MIYQQFTPMGLNFSNVALQLQAENRYAAVTDPYRG